MHAYGWGIQSGAGASQVAGLPSKKQCVSSFQAIIITEALMMHQCALTSTMEPMASQYRPRSNVAAGRNELEGVQRWRGTYTEGRHPQRGVI